MFSIYCSVFNLKANLFDWKAALLKFRAFSDELVVATTKNNDNSILELYPFCVEHDIKLVVTEKSLDDYDFDGFLKNAALRACTQEFCILLDLDEEINIKYKDNWINFANQLKKTSLDALMIPVIDLYNSEEEYKSIGTKWYLHKNKPELGRGIVNFAKLPNGRINHEKSDTCELIHIKTGDLCSATPIFPMNIIDEQKLKYLKQYNTYVIHRGWLNKQQRQKQQQFWEPVWSNRAGFEVNTKINFDKITYKKHNLF
jgi:hypothetical protein